MTKDEILSMAKEAGMFAHTEVQPEIVRFAALVAEKATEQANARQNASWALMCEKMVAAEREACALLLEENVQECNGPMGFVLQSNADAIRARGQK
jgi:hypothetical protein